MLDGLSRINWKEFDAEELPNWLRALRSDDFDIRLTAGFKLSQYFCEHSHSLNVISEIEDRLSTDVPVLATPFILELLEVDDIDNKKILFDILYTVSDYYLVDKLTGEKRQRAEAIHQIILEKLKLLLVLLHYDDLSERATLIYTLKHFTEQSDTIVEHLLNWAETFVLYEEEAKIACAAILFKLIIDSKVEISQQLERFTTCLYQWIESPLDTISTKAYAAHYLICLLKDDVDDNIIQLLSNTLNLPSSSDLYPPLWSECVDAFSGLSESRCFNTLLDILDSQTDLRIIFDVSATLIAIYFNADKYSFHISYAYHDNSYILSEYKHTAPQFTVPFNQKQKTVIHHLIEKSAIWEVETNLFGIFGLPSSQDELSLLIT